MIAIIILMYCSLLNSLTQKTLCPDSDVRPIKNFELMTGITQQKEKNLHGRVFNGLGYSFVYTSMREEKNISTTKFSIGNSHLGTSLENGFQSLSLTLNMNYIYEFQTFYSDKWRMHTGPGSALNYNISFYKNWDESHLYWSNFFDMSLNQRFEYTMHNENKLIGRISIPVFHIVSRPEKIRDYKIDDLSFGGIIKNFHGRPELIFPNKASCIVTSIEYYTPHSRSIPNLMYTFSYQSLETSYSSAILTIHHRLGLKWTF